MRESGRYNVVIRCTRQARVSAVCSRRLFWLESVANKDMLENRRARQVVVVECIHVRLRASQQNVLRS